MARIRWTNKKGKKKTTKTKALKDIATPSKDGAEVDVEENVVPEKGEERSGEEEERPEGVNNVEQSVEKSGEEEERSEGENAVEENEEKSGEEEARSENDETKLVEDEENLGEQEERSEEDEAKLDDNEEERSDDEEAEVDENEENSGEQEERSDDEEANLDDNEENPGEQEQMSNEEEANLEDEVVLENEKNSGEKEHRAYEEDANMDQNDVEEGGEEGGTNHLSKDSGFEEPQAIKPLGMYFPPSEYRKKIKLSTRCFIAEVLKTFRELKPPMSAKEKNWFEKHPQFKHIFHMPLVENHKVMGMWMLLLRTVRTERTKEAWFAVNGCPIRYGIREHALISGLNCKNYPLNYKRTGGTRFVRKCFGSGTIRYQDVKAKVQEGMEPSTDRLRLLILYFLSSIIVGQRKSGDDAPLVDPYLLRAVDDLNLCKTFPWGRLSFDYVLQQISNTLRHFDGNEKEGVIWPVPGFCIPMELLAFEAISTLGDKFRESVEDVEANLDPTCPRMCQSKFKRSEMKGFPLAKINKELGHSKDIESILISTVDEDTLLRRITEPEDIRDKDDVIVESWIKRLECGYDVRFDDMFDEDVAAREGRLPESSGNETEANPAKQNELVAAIISLKEDMGSRLSRIEDKLGEIEGRLGTCEGCVQELVDGRSEEEEEAISKRPSKKARKN